MDIKMMHEMIEKLTECAKHEVDKGVELVDTKEMGEVTDIIKDLSEAMYYRTLVEAMNESEYGEDYDYMGAYDEHERKGYRGQPRSQSGRFMSRGDGRRSNRGRRGYESPMMYDEDWEEMERNRDFDRKDGKMYYGGSGSSMGGNRGYSESGESRYDRAKRSYTETKEMHKSGTSEDKQITMKEAEKMINVIFDEIDEMLEDAPAELKTMIKTKGMSKMQKIQ